MTEFVCNVCGASNAVENFATEPASCACGSNVRVRALIHLISMELFDRCIALPSFPVLKSIRGIGMSDKEGYASILAQKFDYTNTYYDREPRLDFTALHPDLYGNCDFILSADVLEHIAPPVERCLEEVARMLKPHGFFGVTVYCNPSDQLREHFPNLGEYRIVSLGGAIVLVNRRADGQIEIHENLVFHGGTGATLEMREFGITSLTQKLLASGFREVHLLTGNIPEIGVYFDHNVSQPLIARKEPFMMNRAGVRELLEHIDTANESRNAAEAELNRIRSAATGSRWLSLGRKLGLGPDFSR